MQTELLASPNYTQWNHQATHINRNFNRGPDVPHDPRFWSRNDVGVWLEYMCTVHRLPEVPRDRFIMNGKALCLMTVPMFLDRVPLGGKLLYKDFQLRLTKAMYASQLYSK